MSGLRAALRGRRLEQPAGSGTGGDPSTDKLAQILARGTLILSTDPAYSAAVVSREGRQAARPHEVRRQPVTANQMAGYDADTGKLVAERLGVEPCFVDADLERDHQRPLERPVGHLLRLRGDQLGSRVAPLLHAAVLRRAAAVLRGRPESKYEKPSDLDGKTIGVCAGCTHELYLKRTLTIPGVKIIYKVKNVKIAIFDVENPGLKAVAEGKLDAFLCAAPEGDGAIHNGLKLRALKDPAFFMYPTGFVDRYSAYDDKSFVAKVNSIVQGLHADGTLKKLSIKDFFGADYATKAGQFNLAVIHQVVK